jgi:polyisoprenoid-binding protein YceI
MRALTAFFALLLIGATAHADGAQEPRRFAVERGEVVYHLVHKLHHVEGRTQELRGRALLWPDGRVQAEVMAPVASFDSGNVNRDAHMKEVVEAARYPTLEVKVLCSGAHPASVPAGAPCKAQVDFHGVRQVLDAPVELTLGADQRVKAKTRFTVSLDAFRVERPSLLFVKVDDAIVIDAELIFGASP